MSTTPVKENVGQALLSKFDDLANTVKEQGKTLTDLQTKANTPAVNVPYGIIGASPSVNDGYSFMKAAALCRGWLKPEQAKVEYDIAIKLKSAYKKDGWLPYHEQASFLVPFSTAHIPGGDDESDRLIAETRMRVKAADQNYDPDEAKWLSRKFPGLVTKALGTTSDAVGGTLVGFPSLGELIDIQRNREAFTNAGASEVGLPANGRIQYPKLVGGATAYWVGEAASVTESNQATGNLNLEAKKVGIRVALNNELLRFTSPTTEALVRNDMAQVAARKIDLAMLEGTGGTQIKGLITYDTQAAWAYGVDKVIKLTASTVATDGNTFDPEDVQRLMDALADEDDPTAFVMRKQMFTAIKNRRAGSGYAAADGDGLFMFDVTRSLQAGIKPELQGLPVVRSSQVSGARTKGSGTNLTYIVCGNFKEWLIGRFGVMEFLTSVYGDYFANDQTAIRGIQHIDAGPRHAASFAWMDQLLVS